METVDEMWYKFLGFLLFCVSLPCASCLTGVLQPQGYRSSSRDLPPPSRVRMVQVAVGKMGLNPHSPNSRCTCAREIVPGREPPAPHPYYLFLQAATLRGGFLWSCLSWVIKSLSGSAGKGQIFDVAVSCKKKKKGGEWSTWRPIHTGFISSLQWANKLPASDDSATDMI